MKSIQQSALGLALATGASASLVFSDPGLGTPVAIPDDHTTGILRTIEVSGLATNTAYSVDVSLNITGTGDGGFVGDLYAYLAHQTPGG